jgi:5'-3' exonuclease
MAQRRRATVADASNTAQQSLLLIDLSGIFWANYHATADQHVGEAFERTVGAVRSLVSNYDLVAVCCDAPPYWRRDVLPTYKAQRAEAPPLAVEQFERVKARLRADGHLLWGSKGFEADDVIAWAVQRANSDGGIASVTIASNDKDLHQLVSDRVKCYSPMSQKTYDAAAVIEKHGVPPGMMLDYLALMGDSSDNVPGVPGIGPKNAAALLQAYGDLESVLADAALPDDVSGFRKPKMKASLVEHADAARLARKVIALRTDVPLDWSELRMERKVEPLAERKAEDLDDEPQAPVSNGNGNGHSKPEVMFTADVQPQVRAAPLAVRAPEEWSLALEPRSSKGAWELAGILHDSRLYTKLGGQEAVYAILMRGRSLNMDATTSLSAFHNVGGRITMHADLIEALVLRSGKAEYFEMVESNAKVATYCTKRVGGKREQTLSFTIEDACAAQLVVKDPNGVDGFNGRDKEGKPAADANWSKYRALMLRHRCKTQLARAVYADVVLGLYAPEELGEEVIVEASR